MLGVGPNSSAASSFTQSNKQDHTHHVLMKCLVCVHSFLHSPLSNVYLETPLSASPCKDINCIYTKACVNLHTGFTLPTFLTKCHTWALAQGCGVTLNGNSRFGSATEWNSSSSRAAHMHYNGCDNSARDCGFSINTRESNYTVDKEPWWDDHQERCKKWEEEINGKAHNAPLLHSPLFSHTCVQPTRWPVLFIEMGDHPWMAWIHAFTLLSVCTRTHTHTHTHTHSDIFDLNFSLNRSRTVNRRAVKREE